MLRKLAALAGILALLGTSAATLAQEKGPNGGMVAGKGSHKAELIVTPTELTVYLLEDGKVHDSKGTAIRAVIQQAGKTTTVDFVDQKGEKLVAKLPAPLAKGAVVVVTGKDHHGDQFNARYVIN
jgi:hypothetical protein